MKGFMVVEVGKEKVANLLEDRGRQGEVIESRGWTIYETEAEAEEMAFHAYASDINSCVVEVEFAITKVCELGRDVAQRRIAR